MVNYLKILEKPSSFEVMQQEITKIWKLEKIPSKNPMN